MSLLSFLGTAAAGVNAANSESERLHDEAMKESDRLIKLAQDRLGATQKVGQIYADQGNWAGARALMPQATEAANQAYGLNLATPVVHGTPVMKQGVDPGEQYGPPQAAAGKLAPPPTYEAGRTFDSPEQQAAIRGGLLLPKPAREFTKLGAGDTLYDTTGTGTPKKVAVGEWKPTPPEPLLDLQRRKLEAEIGKLNRPDEVKGDMTPKDYQAAFSRWQQDGAKYVNEYVSLMARNSHQTRVQNGVTMTVPPTPEQMKAWRTEGEALYKSTVDQPMPPSGIGKPGPFKNPKAPSGGKVGGGTARWAPQIQEASKATGVPAEIIRAVMRQESGGNPNARSPVGAIGLMQFMPGTAAGMGINPADPDQAVLAGAKYLKANYEKFGSWKKAIAAYNAGPGAVQKYGGIPPYKETQGYVQRITDDLKAQGIEISAAETAKVASIYEKYGITPGSASSANIDGPARPAMRETSAPPNPVRPGNIDTTRRPQVKNADGSISTVRSISVGFEDGTYLLPTVIGKRVVSDEEAIAHFRKTGQHLGVFRSPDEADAYADWLHREQEQRYVAPTLPRP